MAPGDEKVSPAYTPGKEAKFHQLVWHEAERARGALVKVVDHYETFRDWYRGVFS